METRKYQLKKQILEALKANDNNLYSLLKSQWAHRFGVESLEELNNLDLNESNLNLSDADILDKKIDQSQEKPLEAYKAAAAVEDENIEENEIKIRESDPVFDNNHESVETNLYEKIGKENSNKTPLQQNRGNIHQPKVETLIPLPPKPKYSYLKKWILRK